ncbi:serine O-acetyltransferase [Clostridium chromiireducens]|uniref:serine O-acetyltransferase n=1 Tax=Clostridium chromiireducens TaxID=225345 RepID=UPI003AF8FA21
MGNREFVEYEKYIYFKNRKSFFKALIYKEHEYYLWKFVKYLRKEENSNNKIIKIFYRRKKNILGSRLGLTIPEGVFERGLHIWHYGNIVVNGYAKVGKNCVLHGDNCIGNDGKSDFAPVIGDNVELGVGAKVLGNINIADNIKIGAGAIVVQSFNEPGITVVGVPARKVR